MHHWEYCVVHVAEYREGSGGGTIELLEITKPGANRTQASHPLGSIGLFNQLGAEGWELVDVEGNAFYFKRSQANVRSSAM